MSGREYLQQIKGKIASILLQNLLIDDCAVFVNKTKSSSLAELVVYVVSSQPPLLNQLQSYLQGVIPDSILPTYVLVSELPRNSIGEIDEKALKSVPQKSYPQVKLAFSDGGALPFVATPTTLIELLQTAAQTSGEILYLENGQEISQSYAQLLTQAEKCLFGLRQLKLLAGDKVILLLKNNCDILPAFWGCVLGGFIPVIMEVPPTYSDAHPALDKLRHIWEFLAKPLIITSEKLVSSSFQKSYVDVSELSNNESDTSYYKALPDDVAFISLTSGSTGIPKCIQLTHRNLITRARGTNLFNQHQSDDKILNWLPFDHIGSISDWHIRCLEVGCKVVYAQKDEVLGQVLNWLDLIAKHRITHSWSPSFAYTLVKDALQNDVARSWDLSCVKFLLTAGEAISSQSVQACLEKLARYGLKKTAIRPAFGMAELGSGVTYYQPTETAPLNFHQLDSSSFEEIKSRTFADLGAPIPGVAIRIVDSTGVVLPENAIGCLQVKGDVVFPGYYNYPQANVEAFSDGWFNTGDLGFISNGGLAIAGRIKETIIINGANYYSHEIEQVVETVTGVESTYTAACAVQVDTTEKLAIFFSCGLEGEELLELLRLIRQTVLTQIGINPSYLIPVAKDIIPKTAIGKIQRQQLSKLFELGEFDSIIGRLELLTRKIVKTSMTDNETQIAQIWQQVLGFTVGSESNFFELGGNSLLLLQVQHKLQTQFGKQLTVADMFKYATVKAMAGYLSNQTVKNAIAKRITTDTCDIAVIGMACRFPGANNVDEFWQNLCDGVESISFFSDEEVLASGVDPMLLNNPNYVKAKPAIADIELFDAEFFGYSPKEAQLIDPQQRLLLECAWESLEDSGCNPLTYKGAIGIYAGAVMNTYLLNNVYPSRHNLDSQDNLQAVTLDSMGGFQMMVANDKDYLTTRVSYKLNLTGPSVNVQTACSTSLVAIHMACQSLLNGECDMSLAGGVSVAVPQRSGYLYQEGTIVSPDGHCRAFDAKAKGTIFGNGVGIVVLKKLQNAIADSDRIYAVIKGTAINNDGSAKVGYLAPNGDGQAKVASQAMAQAGVKAQSIGYVEMHGTGTVLGDPIEVGGLTQAFRENTQNKGFCAIGSVKTNVGHLQIASGVAGFIKTVLTLHHQKIPPSLHFQTPSPQIDFANSPFYVNTSLQDWEASPRFAGVNSLGVGGTNAHVILTENVQTTTYSLKSDRPIHLLTLSAKNPSALQALIKRYQVFLTSHLEENLADICFTANTGRSHFQHRIAIVADSINDLTAQLDSAKTKVISKPRIAFLFTGQGSQYVGMGQELYDQPVFRANIDECDRILRLYLEKPLLEILYPLTEDTSINETNYSQSAIFALEYALYKLWQSWGVHPEIVMGHSIGEYVAAVIAGVFSLEDGLKLIAARGRLMQTLAPGGMVVVRADIAKVQAAIADYEDIAISAINGIENIVISGSPEALQSVVARFTTQGIETRFLNVSRPFHSPLMQPILEEFEQVAREITYNLPSIAIVSNITGEIVNEAIATPEYWCNHILKPVQFAAGMKTLQQAGFNVFVECGAKPILLGMGRLLVDEGVWLPSLRPSANWRQILSSLALLYEQGVTVDWVSFDSDYPRCKVGLPTYPFQKQRHWIESPLKNQNTVETLRCNVSTSTNNVFTSTINVSTFTHPLLGQKLPSALKDIVFQSVLTLDTPAFLKDHCVYEQVVLPGAAYIEMALAAASQVLKNQVRLEKVDIQRALILAAKPQLVQLILSKEAADYSFAIYSLDKTDTENWTLHTSGKIVVTQDIPKQVNIAELRSKFTSEIAVETHYLQCQERGIAYGLTFRAIKQLWKKAEAALGLICLEEELATYQIHPVLLDACFQVIFATLPEGKTYLPGGFASLRVYSHPGKNVWSYVKLRPNHDLQEIIADVYLYDEVGNLVVEINGLVSKQASRKALLKKTESWQDWLYTVEWQIQERQKIDTCEKCDRTWLIFADNSGLGQELATLLTAQNQEYILVFPGKEYKRNSQHFQINPTNSNHSQQLLEDLGEKKHKLSNVIHLWSLDSIYNELTIADLEAATNLGCSSTLHLVQALTAKCSQSLRLILVTRGANSASGIANSCLGGMSKVITLEHPELNCTHIDLDETAPQNEVSELFAEIWHPQNEAQIAFKAGNRTVARLVRSSFSPQLKEVSLTSNQLVITHRGSLDNLQWQSVTRSVPSFGQVEIQVQATGLNFRDVLNALGLYPEAGALGLECAGNIVAIGEGVDNFQIGDRILAMMSGSFSQYVTVDAHLVVSIPASLSFAEAATIPGAFLTAYYGLHHLAKIQPGEKVLIHAATGGVGLAAVHLAQAMGAEIFATASPSKGYFLRSIGVKHIMNSRTLDFADEITEITHGLGVDIVLNCLTGEFIPKSLSVLADNGRFVEIGKLGIWEATQVERIKPNAAYFIFDLLQVTQQQPDLIAAMLRQITMQFTAGKLKPLPCKIFPVEQVIDAFRYMQQAKHIGKIAIAHHHKNTPTPSIRSDATYLITGGLGDLGLLVAKLLANKGAKHLVLVGRNQPTTEVIEQLKAQFADINLVFAQADVAKTSQLAQVLTDIESLPPLRGIIHAAGILDDGILQQQTWERFEKVLAPKVQGAWNLHSLTRNCPLDFFIMFSSVASLLGSAGQANYAAANSFLDALAHTRNQAGSPTLSINWGAWSGLGLAAKPELEQQLQSKGMGTINPQQGLEALEQLLFSSEFSQVGVVPIDWAQWWQKNPFYSQLALPPTTPLMQQKCEDVPPQSFLRQLENANKTTRHELIIEYVRSLVAKILGLNSPHSLDAHQGFADLGIDSLTSVELRNQLQSSLGCTLPSTLAFDYPTVAKLTDYLTEKLLQNSSFDLKESNADIDSTVAQMQQLTEAEAEALLLDELENLLK
ncbi:type I polyketide synthase [Chlorogloea sp. CCALA 695]|uniref:type I polyketide synthase n=1 Tax=Chlorogloea sp. CCALA 695 TaxID=2107693 RepID=UPI000D04AFAE|nr:type I polyketide synthase [Chlorogloea sp. CCALA 695]PSB34990.1 polyketide synthase [Chlorogloea sp. CCALA 695]